MNTNFEALWIGLYNVENILGFNSYILQDMKDKRLMFPINEQHLKGFFTKHSHSPCTLIYFFNLYILTFDSNSQWTKAPSHKDFRFLTTL
jgi:hypothetical protein